MVWKHNNSTCGLILTYLEFGYSLFLCIAILFVNTTTFLFIRKMTKSSRQSNVRKKNIRLYVQVCITGGVLTLIYLYNFVVTLFMPKRWGTSTSITIAWEAVHSINGLVFLAFNRQLFCSDRKRCLRVEYRTNAVHIITINI
ncbi:hypothetical protein RB195_004001 [Necator americanus]|uniref:7TM GPCR serpentine receptor class x (Srx) domain-containing protein n=1 Tax=Necator americanus TaxID=51031 RepID=A0ABR1DR89_NECAM